MYVVEQWYRVERGMWWNRVYSGIVIEGTCMQGRGQTDLGVLGEECDGHW